MLVIYAFVFQKIHSINNICASRKIFQNFENNYNFPDSHFNLPEYQMPAALQKIRAQTLAWMLIKKYE